MLTWSFIQFYIETRMRFKKNNKKVKTRNHLSVSLLCENIYFFEKDTCTLLSSFAHLFSEKIGRSLFVSLWILFFFIIITWLVLFKTTSLREGYFGRMATFYRLITDIYVKEVRFSLLTHTAFSRLLAPLTDSILVEAAHQHQFPWPKVSRKTG